MAPITLTTEDWNICNFLTSICWDQFYVPMDSPLHEFSYFKPTPLNRVLAAWRNTAALIRSGRAPKSLTLYVHWPYCPSQCTFCFCDMQVPNRAGLLPQYAAMLRREMDVFSEPLRGLSFTNVWFGGGTPTFIPDAELDTLLSHLRSRFTIADDARIYFEVSPATLTLKKLQILRKHGVNHITLGAQTLNDRIISKLDRKGQTRDTVLKAYSLVKACPEIITDLDLMVGLNGQSPVTFLREFIEVLKLDPSIVHLYPFDPRPQTRFVRGGKRVSQSRTEGFKILMRFVARIAKKYGYESGMMYKDVEEEQESPDSLEIRGRAVESLGGSVLGLGYSAISHAFGSLWYQHKRVTGAPLETDRLPPILAIPADMDEEMRGYLIRNLTRYGKVYKLGFQEAFGLPMEAAPALRRSLGKLDNTGKLRIGRDRLWLETSDLVERLVLVKHLYSNRVKTAILEKHSESYRKFFPGAGRAGSLIPLSQETKDKINSRSLLMMCAKKGILGRTLAPRGTC